MAQFDPRHDPVFQPGFDPAVHSRAPIVAQRVEGGDVGMPPATDVAPGTFSGPSAPQPALERNPWLRRLTILGVVFLALGVALTFAATLNSSVSWSGSTPPLEVILVQSSWLFTAPLMTAGLVALVVRVALGVLGTTTVSAPAHQAVPLQRGEQ